MPPRIRRNRLRRPVNLTLTSSRAFSSSAASTASRACCRISSISFHIRVLIPRAGRRAGATPETTDRSAPGFVLGDREIGTGGAPKAPSTGWRRSYKWAFA